MIRKNLLDPNGSIKFPYELFPWRLEYKDKSTICYFECEEHLQKYIDRYRLKSKDISVENRDGKSLISSKKHKRSIQSSTSSHRNGSAGASKGRTTRVDSVGDTDSTPKRKRTLKK
jgi:hypothetical protein